MRFYAFQNQNFNTLGPRNAKITAIWDLKVFLIKKFMLRIKNLNKFK
jgi:hypothetical protein